VELGTNISEVTKVIAPHGVELTTAHWCRMALLVCLSFIDLCDTDTDDTMHLLQRELLMEFPKHCPSNNSITGCNIPSTSTNVDPNIDPSLSDHNLDATNDLGLGDINDTTSSVRDSRPAYKSSAFWNFVDDQLISLRENVKIYCQENVGHTEVEVYHESVKVYFISECTITNIGSTRFFTKLLQDDMIRYPTTTGSVPGPSILGGPEWQKIMEQHFV
jgi:hypothetical protein